MFWERDQCSSSAGQKRTSNVIGYCPQTDAFGLVQEICVVKFDDDFGLDVKVPSSQDRRQDAWIQLCRGNGQFARQTAVNSSKDLTIGQQADAGDHMQNDLTGLLAAASDCIQIPVSERKSMTCPYVTTCKHLHDVQLSASSVGILGVKDAVDLLLACVPRHFRCQIHPTRNTLKEVTVAILQVRCCFERALLVSPQRSRHPREAGV